MTRWIERSLTSSLSFLGLPAGIALWALLLLPVWHLLPAHAQAPVQGQQVKGDAQYGATVIVPTTITTGNTFQSALASIIGTSSARLSLTVQNNNTNTDNCWVYPGPTASATEAAAILLAPGQSYQRYWPRVPPDNIAVTCAGNADTMYVDHQ